MAHRAARRNFGRQRFLALVAIAAGCKVRQQQVCRVTGSVGSVAGGTVFLGVRVMIEPAVHHETVRLGDRSDRQHARSGIAGGSAAVQQMIALIAQSAPLDVNVLILGESGTGKELVARAIHRNSRRADGPFIKLNCGALAETLLESELFGYEKGAFTGATDARPGTFETADGGTWHRVHSTGGLLEADVMPDGMRYHYRHDLLGHVAEVDMVSAAGRIRTVRAERDPEGRVTRLVRVDDSAIEYEHSPEGDLLVVREGQRRGGRKLQAGSRIRIGADDPDGVDRETGGFDHGGQPVFVPPREEAPGKVIALTRTGHELARLPSEHGQLESAAGGQHTVDLGQRQGQVGGADVLVSLGGPDPRERATPEREVLQVALDHGHIGGLGLGGSNHGGGCVDRHRRGPEVREVVAGTAAQVQAEAIGSQVFH